MAHPWQGPVLCQDVLDHQHLQHFLDASPANGSVLVPPPPAEGRGSHLPSQALCQPRPPVFPEPSPVSSEDLLPSGTIRVCPHSHGHWRTSTAMAGLWRIFFRDPAGPHLACFRFVCGSGPWPPCPSSHRPLRAGAYREVRGAVRGGGTGLGGPGAPTFLPCVSGCVMP